MWRSPKILSVKDYTYELADNRIARFPLEERDSSKLLVYRNGTITDRRFDQLPQFLDKGDRVVFNETKVIHARLLFIKETGGVIEILCLEPYDTPDPAVALSQRGKGVWKTMIGNLKRWKDPVIRMEVKGPDGTFELTARISGETTNARIVQFEWEQRYTFAEVITAAGKLPIPPYLDREAEEADEVRYQTVYARHEGSVAAPTAGLHFTEKTLSALAQMGVDRSFVTLHVGAGTFLPVKSETMEGHDMHEERIIVSRSTVEELQTSLAGNGRILAVGTTSLRTLESLYWIGVLLQSGMKEEITVDQWFPYEIGRDIPAADALQSILDHLDSTGKQSLSATTKLLVAPGYRFRMVEALVTNFHQPDSTLLLLVAAFIGEDWRKVYRHALENGYRFLSYGDSSLLFRKDE